MMLHLAFALPSLASQARHGRQPPILVNTMRLSTEERAAVEHAAHRFLPAGSRVSLFGSRTDDSRRGGDIDLLIEMPALRSAADMVAVRSRFTAHLYRLLGERRIDVLIAAPQFSGPQSVIASARQQAIELVQM